MPDNKVQLIVKVHPMGGIAIESCALDRNPKSFSTGNTYGSPGELSGVFYELGLKDEADRLKIVKWPHTNPTEVVFIVTETEDIMKTLGFREVGAIIS